MSSDTPVPRIPEDSRASLSALPDATGRGDPCYKCTACDAECPVVGVDASFPGPKFQGPEQWRLRSEETPIDPSIDACSNCLRCHAACPQDVDLASMHAVARAKRTTNRKGTRRHVRDRLLANYGLLARVGSRVPRLTNWLASNPLIRRLGESLLGITAERDAPAFAQETFREWWVDRGGARVSSEDKRVAYFHGDYANYHTPEVGKALVSVYEALGYEVVVPPQRCSGAPMVANGFLGDAARVARFNVDRLAPLVAEGYDVVATCTSCSLALREAYPEHFDFEGVDAVAAATDDAVEYLRGNDAFEGVTVDGTDLPNTLSYHAPCHASAQGVAGRSIRVLESAGDVDVTHLGEDCSGMSGTYGWKAERYEASMAIGEELFENMRDAGAERAMTECPTCAMQMEHGTGQAVSHPIEFLQVAIEGRHSPPDGSR